VRAGVAGGIVREALRTRDPVAGDERGVLGLRQLLRDLLREPRLDIVLGIVEHLLRRLRVRILLEDREGVLPVDPRRVGLGRAALSPTQPLEASSRS
jgi:hypothetical protein